MSFEHESSITLSVVEIRMNADSDSDSDLDDYFSTNLPELSELELDILVPNTSRGLRKSLTTQTLQSRLSSTLRRRQSSTSSRRGRGCQEQQADSDNDG